MDIGAIIGGHTNELLGLNKELSERRMAICKKCPLFKKTIVGYVCNSKLWLDLKTGETSLIKKDGYRNGCGCRLDAKTTVVDASCPIGKW
jgi:hypothetical protein